VKLGLTDDVMIEVWEELQRARKKFGPFVSHHEGYAVILEELDELWDEIKANNPAKARTEAIQVAAMAIRFVLDLDKNEKSISPKESV
jgi:hypothetical protein